MKLAEKERRKCASTKRFKYTGAIDVSKAYPKTGSLDDCALLRSEGKYHSCPFKSIINTHLKKCFGLYVVWVGAT